MSAILKELKNITSDNCVTIIMTTHRTKPDYLKDSLNLKNLIKEAENRLIADAGKKEATKIVEKLNKLADEIDHSLNLESLLLFVNEDVAEYTRLAIPVKDRVVIDDNFATRDLLRAMHMETHYYVLVLSQGKVRLIEAVNDKVVKELDDPFPLEFDPPQTANKEELSHSGRLTNLMLDFFKRVDKEVNKVRKTNPLPVLIAALDENYHNYVNVADKKDSIYDTFLNKNKIAEKDFTIVNSAWKIVQEHIIKRNNARIAELKEAVTANKFLSDTNEIWRGILAGRVQTLFIEQGLFQPAIIKDNQIIYVSDAQRNDKGVFDDIYDEMIEANLDFGGDVVFLPKGELGEFNGFGAITRY
ncbi:MAG: hypothetical protein WC967_00250 [Balneolaceae bacterium]